MRTYFTTNLSAIRRTVQASFGLFTLYVGFQFFQFYQWAMGQGAYVPRPPAVEAFLPISALMGLKRFVYTGEFDPVHPAGLVILVSALSISLLARKGFCGWICPVGFASHLAQWLGGKLHIQFRLPNWLSFLLSGFKYILLAFFLYVIVWSMDVTAITSFLQTPYNVGADAKMLQFFLAPSTITIFVLSFLVVVSFFLINFWCRFLCPYGALLGLIAYFSPLTIHRDAAQCISCQKCDRQCPGGIRVSQKTNVRSPECIGCLECIAVCPKEKCLSLRGPAKSPLAAWLLPAVTVTVFLAFWALALFSGHWHSKVSPEIFRQIYQMVEDISHPAY